METISDYVPVLPLLRICTVVRYISFTHPPHIKHTHTHTHARVQSHAQYMVGIYLWFGRTMICNDAYKKLQWLGLSRETNASRARTKNALKAIRYALMAQCIFQNARIVQFFVWIVYSRTVAQSHTRPGSLHGPRTRSVCTHLHSIYKL